MKLVLSRKGCDSGSGGCDSPILDGKFISLPIPAAGIPYDAIDVEPGLTLLELMHQLRIDIVKNAWVGATNSRRLSTVHATAVPPVSVVLAANYAEYERGLTAFRDQRVEEWCATFARAVTIACRGAAELAARIEQFKARWREQAGSPRADSAAAKLIELLPLQPVLDLRTVQDALDVSDEAARLGIARLEGAGVLSEITKRRRGRAWECVGLFALLDSFERLVATPTGASAPTRRVPRPTRRPSEIAAR